jgi:hypothetical protein
MPPLAADISTVARAGGRNDIRLLPQGSQTSAALATAVSLRRALLLPVQPKCFELPTPFRRSIAQPRDVDAARQGARAILLAAELEGSDGAGKDELVGFLRKVAKEDLRAFGMLLERRWRLLRTGRSCVQERTSPTRRSSPET